MFKRAHIVLLPALLMSLMLSLVLGCAKTPPPVEEEAAKVKAAPCVTITPNVAKIDSKLQMVMMGSGFEPGQEIRLIVSSESMGPSTINGAFDVKDESMCDPLPVPDEAGNWITTWSLKSYIRVLATATDNKGEGIYTLSVTDAHLNLLASAQFALADTTKPKEQWPAWAQVLLK